MEFSTTRAKDENSSKTRFEVKDKQRFRKKFPNQSLYTITRVNKGKGSTPSLKRRKVVVLIVRSLLVLIVKENMKASV